MTDDARHRRDRAHATTATSPTRTSTSTACKRIEGQARGIHKMVEDEKYCIDILTQISALTSALEAVAVGLLDDHLRHCVVDAAQPGRRRGRREDHRGDRGDRPPGALGPAQRDRQVSSPTSETPRELRA